MIVPEWLLNNLKREVFVVIREIAWVTQESWLKRIDEVGENETSAGASAEWFVSLAYKVVVCVPIFAI